MKCTAITVVLVLILTACSPGSEHPSAATAATPQFPIAAADITSATPDGTSVHVEFTKAKADAFRKFTKEHLNQKVQVLVGTNVVAEPVIRSEIPGGKIDVSFRSAERAQAFAASVSQK